MGLGYLPLLSLRDWILCNMSCCLKLWMKFSAIAFSSSVDRPSGFVPSSVLTQLVISSLWGTSKTLDVATLDLFIPTWEKLWVGSTKEKNHGIFLKTEAEMEDQSEEKIDGFFSETLEDLKTQTGEKNDGFFCEKPGGFGALPSGNLCFFSLEGSTSGGLNCSSSSSSSKFCP